ncbi:hypothetical protein SNEBB_004308 [Seison nebaliae]|nr:hypothetical protein SNEBB_004308 [Seison nebaliae]
MEKTNINVEEMINGCQYYTIFSFNMNPDRDLEEFAKDEVLFLPIILQTVFSIENIQGQMYTVIPIDEKHNYIDYENYRFIMTVIWMEPDFMKMKIHRAYQMYELIKTLEKIPTIVNLVLKAFHKANLPHLKDIDILIGELPLIFNKTYTNTKIRRRYHMPNPTKYIPVWSNHPKEIAYIWLAGFGYPLFILLFVGILSFFYYKWIMGVMMERRAVVGHELYARYAKYGWR